MGQAGAAGHRSGIGGEVVIILTAIQCSRVPVVLCPNKPSSCEEQLNTPKLCRDKVEKV